MTLLRFIAPPLPHYIIGGEVTYPPGKRHADRNQIGVFDLLVVTMGTLWIHEETKQWKVDSGQTLILRPDCHHFSTQSCTEETHFFWLHFQTTGEWMEVLEAHHTVSNKISNLFQKVKPFDMFVPRYRTLTDPTHTYEKLRQLHALKCQSISAARWQEQLIFQQVLFDLMEEQKPQSEPAVRRIADQTALLLRQNYRHPLSYSTLGEELNFHPTYVARCMKQVFGCTPLEYLNHYRLEQAKLLLLSTDMPIGQIAEEVGFKSISYFTRCFTKMENTTPRKFRNQFRS